MFLPINIIIFNICCTYLKCNFKAIQQFYIKKGYFLICIGTKAMAKNVNTFIMIILAIKIKTCSLLGFDFTNDLLFRLFRHLLKHLWVAHMLNRVKPRYNDCPSEAPPNSLYWVFSLYGIALYGIISVLTCKIQGFSHWPKNINIAHR